MTSLITSPPDDLTDHIITYDTKLSHLLDSHVPLKSRSGVKRTNCDWFTSKLGELKCHLQALERKYKASGLAID